MRTMKDAEGVARDSETGSVCLAERLEGCNLVVEQLLEFFSRDIVFVHVEVEELGRDGRALQGLSNPVSL